MGQYRPMFNISMEHNYFSSGKLAGTNFVPTAATRKLMNNVNLVSRPRPDGITMFYDGDYFDALKMYAADAEEPLRVEFNCDVGHQNFQNFTESSIFAANMMLHFDSANQYSESLGKKLLHAEDYVSANELIAHPALNDTHARLADRRAPSLGRISIQITSKELDELSTSGDHHYNDYTIRFQARETHWKYYLIGEANREGVYLRDTINKVDFEYLGEEQIADGRMAKIFITRQAIPMRDRAKPKFQLVVTKNNRPKVLVNRLAAARAKRINKATYQNSQVFVSEIYVNF